MGVHSGVGFVFGGVQLVMLGIIGEYLAGVFSESKRRPLYIVREYLPASRKGKAGREGE